MKVLMVDDSQAFRERVRRHLEEATDFTLVGEARDGVEAIREIERLGPDVVLLDLHLPELDGYAVLHHVKQQLPATKVVVLTGDASALVRQRCTVLHADAVIDKRDAASEILPTLRRMSGVPDERIAS